jgi:tetratricopeptide (TPR) repeat protein
MSPRRAKVVPAAVGLLLANAVALAVVEAPAFAQAPAAAPGEPAPSARKRRQPPPAIIPIEDTTHAQKQYSAGNYEAAVAQAKVALTKNEKYTPAMLVMAKAYYRLHKYEWVSHLWKMMQANNASDAEKGEMYHLLAWMEIEKSNVRGSIEMLSKATEARPENAVLWNNLGAQYLEAKNYKEAAPVLEKAVQLNPTFAKAFVNLGSAYRGLKAYDRAQTSYERALQLFPNYADAIFHLGLLYLDADNMPGIDTIARLNTAITHFSRYKQMMGGLLQRGDPVDAYVTEAQDKIVKEQKRIERQKKQEERDRARAAAKPAQPGQAPAPAGAPARPAGAAPAPAAPRK